MALHFSRSQPVQQRYPPSGQLSYPIPGHIAAEAAVFKTSIDVAKEYVGKYPKPPPDQCTFLHTV